MALMTQQNWDDYEALMNAWQEDAFQQDIIWHRKATRLSIHGEDNNHRFGDLTIKGLVQYNHFRAWPITQATDSGEIDKQSCMLYLNINYLESLGYTNTLRQFMFDPGYDRFSINGVKYKAFGESQVSQANNKPLFIFIILKREELETGKEKYANI